jgi:type IV pilus assembly protein PilW
VDRVDTAGWNAAGFPTAAYNDGDALVNLGTMEDNTYAISAGGTLQQTRLSLDPATTAPSYNATARDLFPNVVALRALYGMDTDNDNIVDTYTQVTPTTNAQWLQVRTLRVALVARSGQYERDPVTGADPLWDVGNKGTITPAPVACGTSKCLTLRVNDGSADWQHYRYKVFDTEIPLRNLLWQP